jgi:hypothetical protein
MVLFRFQVFPSHSSLYDSPPQGICALLLFSLSETVRQVWMSDVDMLLSLSRNLASSSQLSDSSQQREKEEDVENMRTSLRKGEGGNSGLELAQ